MATTLYLRSNLLLDVAAGTSTTTQISTATSTNATQIYVLAWTSKEVATGFTLSGTISVSLQASESSMSANLGGRVYVYKIAPNNQGTLIGWGDDGVEFSTSNTQMDWTITPDPTVINPGDRLIVEVYLVPVGGSIAGGYNGIVYYDGAAGSAYDSSVTFSETITFGLVGAAVAAGTGSLVAVGTKTSPPGGQAVMAGTGLLSAAATVASPVYVGLINQISLMYLFNISTESAAVSTSIPVENWTYFSQPLSSPTTGYFLGGTATDAVTLKSFILKSPFSSLSISQISAALVQARGMGVGLGDGIVGYVIGGNAATSPATTAEKFTIASETIASTTAALPTARRRMASMNNASYGYALGGYDTTYSSGITRMVFATETISDSSATLTNKVQSAAAVNNENAGYVVGGEDASARAYVDRFDLVTETTQSQSAAPANKTLGGAISARHNGYIAGGQTAPSSSATNTIFKVGFITGATTQLSNTLGSSGRTVGASSRSTAGAPYVGFRGRGLITEIGLRNYYKYGLGFVVGGVSGSNNVTTQERFNFASDSRTTTSYALPIFSAVAGTSSGTNGLVPSRISNPTGWGTSEYPNLAFLTETNSRVSAGITLTDPSGLPFGGSTTGGAKGYVMEGSYVSSVDYATYAVSHISNKSYLQGMVASKTATYWKGYTTVYTLNKLLHSTEAISDLGAPPFTNPNKSHVCTVQSGDAGYHVGGWISSTGSTNEITKITYASDTVTSIGATLTTARDFATGLSSSTTGYIAGGLPGNPAYPSISPLSSVEKLDFANGTTSVAGFSLSAATAANAGLWTPGGTYAFVTLSGAGDAVVVADVSGGSRATLDGVGTLTAVAQLANAPVLAQLNGAGALAIVPVLVRGGAATASGAGALTAVVADTHNAYGEGYVMSTSTPQVMVFQTDTNHVVSGALSRVSAGAAAVATTAKGYISCWQYIDTYLFDTWTAGQHGSGSDYMRSGMYNLSSQQAGYFLAGYRNPSELQTTYTDKLLYANGAVTQVTGTSLTAILGAFGASVDGTENGYLVNSRGAIRMYAGFNYASEAAHEAQLGSHPTSHYTSGVAHGNVGYVFSGYNSGYASAVDSKAIVAVLMATETLRETGQELSYLRGGGAAVAGRDAGYLLGGTNVLEIAQTHVDKFAFWNETVSVPSSALGQPTFQMPGISRSGFKADGYAISKGQGTVTARGFAGSTLGRGYMGRIVALDGLHHSSETTYHSGWSYGGLHDEPRTSSSYSTSVGYFFSGSSLTYIDGIIYQTEARRVMSATFDEIGAKRCTTESATAAYMAGGLSDANEVYLTKAYKLLFATEALSTLSATLGLAKSASADVRSSTTGFFVAGQYNLNSDNVIDPTTNIQSVSFSSDTISTESAALSTARIGPGGTSSSTYGYIAAGAALYEASISTLESLRFSTKAVATLSQSVTNGAYSMACSLSPNKGYYGGGSCYGFPSVNTIDAVTFSSEAVGRLSATLSPLTASSFNNASCGVTAAYTVAVTHFAAATAGGVGGATVVARTTRAGKSLAAGSGTASATATVVVVHWAAAVAAGAGSIVVSGSKSQNGASLNGGSGTLTAIPGVVRGAQASASGVGSAASSACIVIHGECVASGNALVASRAALNMNAAVSLFAAGSVTAQPRRVAEFLQWHSASVRPQVGADTCRPLSQQIETLARVATSSVRPAIAEQVVSAALNEANAWVLDAGLSVAPELLVVSARPVGLGVVVKDADIITELGG